MRVLVSGAGIAGNAVAWWLSKAGARVTVIEKAAELLPHGQNVDLMGSALTVIRKMQLLDAVKRANTTEKVIDLQGFTFPSVTSAQNVYRAHCVSHHTGLAVRQHRQQAVRILPSGARLICEPDLSL